MRELAWRRAQASDALPPNWRHASTRRLTKAFVSEKLAEAERDARLLDLAMELKWSEPSM